jgi:hypothetical protein
MSVTAERADLHALEPDPFEPSAEEVERYVAALQEIADDEPELARTHVWRQIRLAGARAAARRQEALDSLNRLFRLGAPPDPPLEGPQHGILVTPITAPLGDSALRVLAGAWMPWLGKRFDPASRTGDNLLAPSARVPTRAIWPSYRPMDAPEGRLAAFRFQTRVSPGTVDPDRQTLKIDYDSDENPSLLIRDILDELVEIVPGANLGKVLLRRGKAGRPGWRLIGYFALEPFASAG